MPENAAYEGFKRATEALTDALTQRLTGLTKQTEDVLKTVQGQVRRTRRWIAVLCATLVLSLFGLAAVGFTVHRLDNQQMQVESIETRLSHRSQVLCPLYTIFIQSDTPEAAKIAQKTLPKDQIAQRAHAFQVIRKGYKQLECTPHLDKNGHLPGTLPVKPPASPNNGQEQKKPLAG